MRWRAAWAVLVALIIMLVIVELKSAELERVHISNQISMAMMFPENIIVIELPKKPNVTLSLHDEVQIGNRRLGQSVLGQGICAVTGCDHCFGKWHIQSIENGYSRWQRAYYDVPEAKFFQDSGSLSVIFEGIIDLPFYIGRHLGRVWVCSRNIKQLVEVISLYDDKEVCALCSNSSIGRFFSSFGGVSGDTELLSPSLRPVIGEFTGGRPKQVSENSQNGSSDEQASSDPSKPSRIIRYGVAPDPIVESSFVTFLLNPVMGGVAWLALFGGLVGLRVIFERLKKGRLDAAANKKTRRRNQKY